MKNLNIIHTSALSACLFFNSCKSNTAAIKTYDDLTLMKKEVLHHVPIGTSSADAKKMMEQSEFKCEFEDDVFLAANPPKYGNILYCDKTTWFFLSGKQWKVIFDRKGKVIENVIISAGGVYP